MSVAEEDQQPSGYKRPPAATRFVKGRSGNPRGRPRNRHREIPYDTVLGQMVTIREEGRERRVTAAEAFILQLTRKGLQGDSAAARDSLAAIETARASRHTAGEGEIFRILIIAYGVGVALKRLGMGIKRNPLSKERVRWELQPWIVQAALDRLGGRVLTPEEQREVWIVTHQRDKVQWPEWWIEKG
ncbi:MAG: hypothetical protein FP826_11315 [Sphingomonadales bacterium]|nr:hypothetical protein [Sphingomonadales bacterium]MBU3991647.1 hypothetical protein [Alphaproteobacteria bacterium]